MMQRNGSAMGWLIPKGLAGRLLLPILIAFVISQIALLAVLQDRKDVQVRDVIERQALMQAVAAANTVMGNPQSDPTALLSGYRSASACSSIVSAPPNVGVIDVGEREVAQKLQNGLISQSSAIPRVQITRTTTDSADFACPELARLSSLQGRPLQVTSFIPLDDERWLKFTSEIEFPDIENWQIIAMFLASAVIVGLIIFYIIRAETRSLAVLADASERLGRGESNVRLKEQGPAEVVAAIRAFNTMQERLRTFIDDRMRTLAAISHDLRTPLTTMRLKAEFVKDKQARESLINTIEEMTTIAESTLAFTRAGSEQERTKTVDVGSLISDLRDEYAAKGLKVGAEVLSPCLCLLREVAFKRAMRNLIDNALRYGGSADCTVERTPSHAVVIVRDDGPGIPADQIEHVFEPFVRLESSRNKETGGIGLGLSITRGIVKEHGGSIGLENAAEGGLLARIELPLAKT